MTPLQKLCAIRELMFQNNVDYYIVPHSDQHMSEYTAKCDERINFISGFSGSAGTVVIGIRNAYLWTDGRYHLQADKELDHSIWTIVKWQNHDVPDWGNWLKKLDENIRIGIDPTLFAVNDVKNHGI